MTNRERPYDALRLAGPPDYAGWLLAPGASPAALGALPSAPCPGASPRELEHYYHARAQPVEAGLADPDPVCGVGPLFGAPARDPQIGVLFLARLLALVETHADPRFAPPFGCLVPAWWLPGGTLERAVRLALRIASQAAHAALDGRAEALQALPGLPAYDLERWEGDPAKGPMYGPRVVGPWRSVVAPDVAAERVVLRPYGRILRSLVPGEASGLRASIVLPNVDPAVRHPERNARNVRVVARAAAGLVRASITALRLVFAAADAAERLAKGPSQSLYRALACVAETDPARLAFAFVPAFGQGGIPPAQAEELDWLFVQSLRRHGARLLRPAWGVDAEMRDSPLRAGRWHHPQARFVDTAALGAAAARAA